MTKSENRCTIAQASIACIVFMLVSLSCANASADEQPMLYFFTSKGCAPCIQVKHVIQQLDSEGYPVTTVDVGQRPDWADAFRVTHTPTLALVRNNEVLAWQPRPMRAEELRGWFRTIRFTPAAPSGSGTNSKSDSNRRTFVGSTARSDTATSDLSRRNSTQTRPAQTKVSLASNKLSSERGGSFTSPTMHNGTRRPKNKLESKALAATVRLQVKDETGISYATGTVVHTHGGESLVLTCGHVFRESKGRGEITAEFDFGDGTPIAVPGQMLDYDSNANDIALVAIQNGKHPLESVSIAPADSFVDRGNEVFSLGCDHGEDPTIRNTAIKNLARYDGSLKYDIFGRPVNGRSGGGLFNAKGQLIGVCNAAAVEVDEGIYTALETVHLQIAKSNLEHLFNASPVEQPADRSMLASADPKPVMASSNLVPIHRRADAPTKAEFGSGPKTGARMTLASQVQNVSLEQPASLDSDKEVVITVRSKTNPQDSRTITISDPTPKLLDYLDGMQGDESRSLKMASYRQWN